MKINIYAQWSIEGNIFIECGYEISHDKLYFSQIYTQIPKSELDFKLYKYTVPQKFI